jgi:GNAT superfamily N-acetyltransferase
MNIQLSFSSRWNVRETMVFESCFHKNLRLSLTNKRALLKASECVWLYDRRTNNLVGETYGTPISYALKDVDEATEDIRPFERLPALYIYSVAVLPRFRGSGLSKILTAYFLGQVAKSGYRWVIAHSRVGRSCELYRAFGASFSSRHRDWYGTGEEYRFWVLKLR